MRNRKNRLIKNRLVVKLGTNNLCCNGVLSQDIFDDFARQIVILINQGLEIVIVTSGAIKNGIQRMNELGLDIKKFRKEDLAAIGARYLLYQWGEALRKYKKEIAQIWVTYANLANKNEKRNIKIAIENFLNSKTIIPVINENDVISDKEIKSMERGISENDKLAMMIALLINADAILFLTDQRGIYDKDPQLYPAEARLYKSLPVIGKGGISEQVIHPSWRNTSTIGRGGMWTKYKYGSKCAEKNMKVCITGSGEKDVILRFIRGEDIGTRITKEGKPEFF